MPQNEKKIFKQKFKFLDKYLDLYKKDYLSEFKLAKDFVFERLNRRKECTFDYPPYVYYKEAIDKDRNPDNLFDLWPDKTPFVMCFYFPFCTNKCSYCTFTNLKKNIVSEFSDYLKYYKKELLMYKDLIKRNKISHIYIGGGTPTLMTEEQLEDLLKFIKKHFLPYLLKPLDEIEFTCEASPPTLTDKKIKILKKYGVNTITLGVQTLDPKVLKTIGRYQTKEQVINVLPKIIKLFKVNVDIIAGLPASNLQIFAQDLNTIVKLKPQHLGVYLLTLYDHSKLGQSDYYVPRKDYLQYYDLAYKTLSKQGYIHSTFEEYSLDHKYRLMYLEDFLENNLHLTTGLGDSGFTGTHWYNNTDDMGKYKNYIKNGLLPIDKKYKMTIADLQVKFIIYGLRKLNLNKKEYLKMFNEPIEKRYSLEINALTDLGFLKHEGNKIDLTYEGKRDFELIMQFFMRL
ncbi:MAG: radical SAM protein [Candidatus Buchananbacteria bacterium]|nr:radical SAM protein [Candidatus Buchananbacteria bacterium]